MKCPNCPRLVNIGRGYGLSRRFCSTKCAHKHAQHAMKTVKANYQTNYTKPKPEGETNGNINVDDGTNG